jgi:hypothetical protein
MTVEFDELCPYTSHDVLEWCRRYCAIGLSTNSLQLLSLSKRRKERDAKATLTVARKSELDAMFRKCKAAFYEDSESLSNPSFQSLGKKLGSVHCCLQQFRIKPTSFMWRETIVRLLSVICASHLRELTMVFMAIVTAATVPETKKKENQFSCERIADFFEPTLFFILGMCETPGRSGKVRMFGSNMCFFAIYFVKFKCDLPAKFYVASKPERLLPST